MGQASRQLLRDVMLDEAATSSASTARLGESDLVAEPGYDYVERNREAWERLGPSYIAEGRKEWQTDELRWGLWGKAESELNLLNGFVSGEDAVELGCGTAAISGWLARRGLHPVGVDIARSQIHNAQILQNEFNIRFPLVCANAEQIAFDNDSFDLALSEYGASLWCNPRRWLPEAHRLLRPEGRLIFITNSALLLTCTPVDGGVVGDRLVRDYFSRYRVEFEYDGPVEFHLTHGQWMRLLRETGFVIDDLVEVQPDPDAAPRFEFVPLEWARRWPSEEIWVAHKSNN